MCTGLADRPPSLSPDVQHPNTSQEQHEEKEYVARGLLHCPSSLFLLPDRIKPSAVNGSEKTSQHRSSYSSVRRLTVSHALSAVTRLP